MHPDTSRACTVLSLLAASALLAGCGSTGDDVPVPADLGARLPVAGAHIGPAVDPREEGPGRFVPTLLARFDRQAAIDFATFADGFYRAPASDGYEAVADRLIGELYAAGYGDDEGFELDVISRGMSSPSWTPQSATLELVRVDERGRPTQAFEVQSFEGPAAEMRVMLPINSPGGEVQGPLADGYDALIEPGMILLTKQRLRDVEGLARERGAIGILSEYVLPYCVDPTGAGREERAIFQDAVRAKTEIPCFYVAPGLATRSLRVGTDPRRSEADRALVRMQASVRFEVRDLRTVMATIRGAERPDEVVHLVSHLDGAGANDNAVGAGAMLQGALLLKRLIAAGELPRPRRSLAFIFGEEAKVASVALDEDERRGRVVVAGIVADMIGQDLAETGATMLLERGWDPAAIDPLAPDEHTPWGAGSVAEEDIVPNGLSIVMREALVDVARAEATGTGEATWVTREHPWEGGSDHDTYLGVGIAGCLLWHFTDFTFATSLDRMEFVDDAEMRRTAVAAIAGALAVADGQPRDLGRHLASLNLERQLRLDAVVRADADEEVLEAWKAWFDGARFWLQAVCLGKPLPGEDGADEGDGE